MTTKYPQILDDNSSIPIVTDQVTAVNAATINNLRSAILAIESELGTSPSGIYGTLKARIEALSGVINGLAGNVSVAVGPVGGDLGGTLPNPIVKGLTIDNQQRGSIIYYNGSSWVQLNPNTDGKVLTTHGTGADPSWTTVSGTSLTSNPPVDITKSTAALGTATLAARADHKHDVSTAAPISIANANVEGTATSLARSDHAHALAGTVGGNLSGTLPNPTVTGLTIASQQQGSVLYFNGTNWVQLSPGTDGYALTTHGPNANPTWSALSSNVSASGITEIATIITYNVSNLLAAPSSNDNYNLVNNDKVGLNGQTITSQNGLYLYNSGSLTKISPQPTDGSLLLTTKGQHFGNLLYLFYTSGISALETNVSVLQGAYTTTEIGIDGYAIPLIENGAIPGQLIPNDGSFHGVWDFDFVGRGYTSSGSMNIKAEIRTFSGAKRTRARIEMELATSATPVLGPVTDVDMLDDGISGPYYIIQFQIVSTTKLQLQIKNTQGSPIEFGGIYSLQIGVTF